MSTRWSRLALAALALGMSTIAVHELWSRTLPGAAPATSQQQAPIRILLFYDMEGASGELKGTNFDQERESLIKDVNAVVAGLFDGGATSVDVKNSHGAGGDSLVPRDALDARAGIVSGPQVHQYNPSGDVRSLGYNAIVTVAMHDKPLSGGYSPHTLGSGVTPIINGVGVTETELVGYAYGVGGLPVIFSSGDDRLQQTLSTTMPWVEYVVVKRITTPGVPVARPEVEVQRELRSGAARAVRDLQIPGRKRVMRLTAPFRAGMLPTYPRLLPPGIGTIPGMERRGDTVTFVASDYRSAYLGFFALQRISLAFYREQVLEEMRRTPAIDSAFMSVTDSFRTRWAAFEQGKWKP